MARAKYTDPERALAEATVAFARDWRDELEIFSPAAQLVANAERLLADHPWVAATFEQQLKYRVPRGPLSSKESESLKHRTKWQFSFIRRALEGFIENPSSFRVESGSYYVDRFRWWFGRGLEPVEAVVDFSYERGRGFRLDAHPRFTTYTDAYIYGLALLLDERRGLSRGLTICPGPAEDGEWCGRFFWRSLRRQHLCSKACATRAERLANAQRQKRKRLRDQA